MLTKFGNITRPASVSLASIGRRSVTVGDVRFLTADGASQTCLLAKTDPCSSSIDPARISDTQITPDFYAADAAKRLRRSAVARIGTPVAHVEHDRRAIGDMRRRARAGRHVCVLRADRTVRWPVSTTVPCRSTSPQYSPAVDESLFARPAETG